MQLSKLKMFLYFRKWNFLAPSLTNSYIFSNFLFCISGGNCPSSKNRKKHAEESSYFFLYFGEWNFLATSLKDFSYFSYILGGNFLSSKNEKKLFEFF